MESDNAARGGAEPNPTDNAAPDPAKARAAVHAIRDLFATIEPPDRMTISDAFGGTHEVRAAIPARAQIIAIQHLERLAELPAGSHVRAATAAGGGIPAILRALVAAASDPEVLSALARSFEVAHPRAVAAARNNASAAGYDGAAPDASDLFPIEELAAGLAPFIIRLVRRFVGLVAVVTEGTNPPIAVP